jgi:hypothetical protein
VALGDVGEIVVTSLDPHPPRIRRALGDLTAALPDSSPADELYASRLDDTLARLNP